MTAVTFAEVPIGHVFKLRRFMGGSCSCFIRKTGEFTYQYVVACETHALHATEAGHMKVLVLGDPTSWNLLYDPFVAELEQL